jgi:hypothetical protein
VRKGKRREQPAANRVEAPTSKQCLAIVRERFVITVSAVITERDSIAPLRAAIAAILCGTLLALAWSWRARRPLEFSTAPDRVSEILSRRAGDIDFAGDVQDMRDSVQRSLAEAGVAVRWKGNLRAAGKPSRFTRVVLRLEHATVLQVVEAACAAEGRLEWHLSSADDEVVLGPLGGSVAAGTSGFVTRIYDVRDLAAGAAAHSRHYATNQEAPYLYSQPAFREPQDDEQAARHLSQFIRMTVNSGTWLSMGGSGNSFGGSAWSESRAGHLVVRADVRTHRELLAALRADAQDLEGTIWEAR